MSAPTFIFGAEGLPKTPQEAARLRAIAQAMAPQGAPKNVGEGLTSLGNAIAYRMMMNKAAAGEAQGQNAANNAFTALMSSLGGGTAPAASSVSNSAQAPSTAPIPANQPPIPGIQTANAEPIDISGSQADFINAILPSAIEQGKRTGIDPRIIVAQAAHESGWGKHAPGNNLFGIKSHGKPGGQKLWTNEVINGKTVRVQDDFRQYDNPADSLTGYSDFILENPRYGKFRSARGLDAQLAELGASGYASDPNYTNAVGKIARGVTLPTATTAVDAVNVMGSGGSLQPNAYVDPMVVTPNSRKPVAQALSQAQPVQVAQAGNGRRGIMDALMAGQPRSQDMPADYFPAAPNPPGVNGPSRQQISRVLTDQFATPEQRAIAQEEFQRMQQANDPVYQMQLEKSRLELEAMRNPKVDPLKVGQGETIIDPVTREVIFKTDPKPENKPAGILEYEYAKQQGFPGTFQDWEASKKGGMSLQVDPATGAVTFQQGGNIKPMTEGQSKDTVFSTRAEGALPLIDQFSDSLTGTEGMVGGTAGQLPVVGNFMKSEGYQQAEQAGKEFLQAILRKDTGAAITAQETNEYGSVYLPRPGDSAKVIEQKKVSRKRALEAIKAGMPPQAILAQEKALANTNAPEEVKPPEGGPPAGTVEDGFRFKGGDPSDERNWEKVQ